MKGKKVVAGFISLVMMIQASAFVTFADSGISRSYVYDDFTVEYEVTNSYEDTEVVDIILTNTGDETIENWMLYFEPNGDIEYVIDAEKITAPDGSIYFKNMGYNADIEVGAEKKITYAIKNCTEVPEYFAFCQSRVEKTDGYTVSLSMGDTWEDSFNGSIVITNNTDEPIEAWELTIDTNFTIKEFTKSWAANVTELGNDQYRLKGTYTSTIAANSSVPIGFIGVRNGDPTIDSYSMTEVLVQLPNNSENYIDLEASTRKLSSEENNSVIFYADTDLVVDEIELVSLDTNEVVAIMSDDGDINSNGDVYMNDGIYSCKVNVDNSQLGDQSFIARYKNVKSDVATIAVYQLFTQQELDDMDTVDEAISNLMNSNGYINSSEEEQVQAVRELLHVLSQGDETEDYALVKSNSILFNHNIYEFEYACGVKGVVFVIPNDAVDGMSTDSNLINDASDDVDAQILFESVGMYGTACIMNGFEPANFRVSYYTQLNNALNSAGLDTTLKSEITVEDMRNIGNYDFISLSMHGGQLSNDDIILAVFEEVSAEKDQNYAYELRTTRTVIKCGVSYNGVTYPVYAVTNGFFTDNYSEDSFDNSIIYLQSCDGFGFGESFDDISYHMTDALLSLGADTVVGNFNTIGSYFNQDYMELYLKGLLDGMTTNEALNLCRTELGLDDGDGDGIVEFKYSKNGVDYYEAVPLIAGETEKYLVNPYIENGDFEDDLKELTGWHYSGYASILKKMGSLKPVYGKRMAIISTRTNEVTESSLYQSFIIPSYANELSFSYNVISEEPLEWIGEGYNDIFTAKLITMDGTVILTSESTDTSTWERISDVNLPNGDNTTYQTGYITYTYDVSELAGSPVKLVFEVRDSGDNTYETAALIDTVSLSN
ncbi:MAG: cellulose binding domain-containing protein [Ruminococcus sp.]|nr:cellulose binding domain-containing protein [Ruminococcus sp.]